MIGRTVLIRRSYSWSFRFFPLRIRWNSGDLCTSLGFASIGLPSLSLPTDVTLGSTDHWLGARTGPGGTTKLCLSSFSCSPRLLRQHVLYLFDALLLKDVIINVSQVLRIPANDRKIIRGGGHGPPNGPRSHKKERVWTLKLNCVVKIVQNFSIL